MAMVLAVRIHEAGGPEVMQLEDLTLEAPDTGFATVRHEAIGLNFIDTYHRSGLYPLPLPSGLGVEAAGVVEEVGAGVELDVGDRVVYCAAGKNTIDVLLKSGFLLRSHHFPYVKAYLNVLG